MDTPSPFSRAEGCLSSLYAKFDELSANRRRDESLQHQITAELITVRDCLTTIHANADKTHLSGFTSVTVDSLEKDRAQRDNLNQQLNKLQQSYAEQSVVIDKLKLELQQSTIEAKRLALANHLLTHETSIQTTARLERDRQYQTDHAAIILKLETQLQQKVDDVKRLEIDNCLLLHNSSVEAFTKLKQDKERLLNQAEVIQAQTAAERTKAVTLFHDLQAKFSSQTIELGALRSTQVSTRAVARQGETMVWEVLKRNFHTMATFEDTHMLPHQADFHVISSDNDWKILVDVKNKFMPTGDGDKSNCTLDAKDIKKLNADLVSTGFDAAFLVTKRRLPKGVRVVIKGQCVFYSDPEWDEQHMVAAFVRCVVLAMRHAKRNDKTVERCDENSALVVSAVKGFEVMHKHLGKWHIALAAASSEYGSNRAEFLRVLAECHTSGEVDQSKVLVSMSPAAVGNAGVRRSTVKNEIKQQQPQQSKSPLSILPPKPQSSGSVAIARILNDDPVVDHRLLAMEGTGGTGVKRPRSIDEEHPQNSTVDTPSPKRQTYDSALARIIPDDPIEEKYDGHAVKLELS